jgi:hypothetical protein
MKLFVIQFSIILNKNKTNLFHIPTPSPQNKKNFAIQLHASYRVEEESVILSIHIGPTFNF